MVKTGSGKGDELPPDIHKLSFEVALHGLEEIVQRLESGDVSLEATGVSITDANNAAVNVVGATLNVVSADGIGTGTDAIETNTGILTFVNTAGVVNIDNTGTLTASGTNTTGTDVIIVTSSPLTVDGVIALGDITLQSTDDGGDDDHLTINGAVESTGAGTISLRGGTDVLINAVVTSAGTVIAEADFDNSNNGTLSDGDGSITTINLLATGHSVALDNVLTTLETLAGDAQQNFTFDADDSYTVGTVKPLEGIRTYVAVAFFEFRLSEMFGMLYKVAAVPKGV